MQCQQDLGRLLKSARQGQGLSQRRLALRAGTSQDAISRIERGVEAPTLERFGQLMLAMGQRVSVGIEPIEGRVPAAELAVSSAMDEPGRQVAQPLDVSGLLEILASHDVAYVVIGGVATQLHGQRRMTMVLDLTPDPSVENLRRLAAALEDLEAKPADPNLAEGEISVIDPERLALAAIVPPLMTRHGQVHILKEPKGARAFEQLLDAALVVEIDGIEVAIASLDDLIRMKRAAGRPGDLDDIAVLTEAERRRGD